MTNFIQQAEDRLFHKKPMEDVPRPIMTTEEVPQAPEVSNGVPVAPEVQPEPEVPQAPAPVVLSCPACHGTGLNEAQSDRCGRCGGTGK